MDAQPWPRGRRALVIFLIGLALPPAATADTVPLPPTFLFDPLLADPKRPRFFVSVLNARWNGQETTAASVGYGGQYGLVRWPTSDDGGNGWQLNLAGGVFAQFDLETHSNDLINADYTVGLPLTYRRGRDSLRLQVYHQSSHLGDEYLLRQGTEPISLSYEALEVLYGRDIGTTRAYAGGEYFFHHAPSSLEDGMLHAGLDYRRPEPLVSGRQAGGTYPVAGADIKAFQHRDWEPALGLAAGLELHPTLPDRPGDQYWALMAVWYEGASPYGPFFTEVGSYWGLSFELNL